MVAAEGGSYTRRKRHSMNLYWGLAGLQGARARHRDEDCGDTVG